MVSLYIIVSAVSFEFKEFRKGNHVKKLIIAIALLTACSSAPLEPEDEIICIPQEIAVCACTGWPTGVTTCTDDSEWGECVCETREYCEHLGEHSFEIEREPSEPIEDKPPTPITRIDGVDPPMGGYGGECVGFHCLGGGARY